MARVTGLEPATSGVTGRRSNQLSYTRLRQERGNTARPLGCQAMRGRCAQDGSAAGGMGADGFEPPTSCV